MNFGPMEAGLFLLVAVLLFGKRLPDAAKGLGRSLKIFKEELKSDDQKPDDKA